MDRLFDAVILDLDGVITRTAAIHTKAWRKMFDQYLENRADREKLPFKPFTNDDYLSFVDGMPRYDGVFSFLKSRGIQIPYGDPADAPVLETICGLGNRKNQLFNAILKIDGVDVYSSTIDFIKTLKSHGIKVGVASSSKNCRNVLEAVGLSDLFDVRIDGEVAAELNLNGKPAPDIFTTACDRLDIDYYRTVVVEDAVSGVQAGEAGRFGLVLGVAREGNADGLMQNGADIVVPDLAAITMEDLNRWFEIGLPEAQWRITFYDYDKGVEKTREALMTVGNGYLGTRGAMEESSSGPINYPGTYMAGVYNRLVSPVSGREIENEDLVNCPNWLPINFNINDGPWMDINATNIESIHRSLDLKSGILHRHLVVVDKMGRKTRIYSERLASMDDPHVCALSYQFVPLNYDGKVTIRTGIDGAIINDGVARYRELNRQHLSPVCQEAGPDTLLVSVKTNQSGTEIAMAAGVIIHGVRVDAIMPETSEGRADVKLTFAAKQDQSVCLEKKVVIYKSNDEGVEQPKNSAMAALKDTPSYAAIKEASRQKWEKLWQEMDIQITGDRLSQKLIRLHMYHLLVTASPHNVHIDAGMPARGLHGEAYRGHIFWDELFVLPFYDLHYPEIAKALLMYRYRRLDQARANAGQSGHRGAMFPWQSGSSGREETQIMHLNPLTGEWGPDHSALQRHVSLAVAFNIWQYFHITQDMDFIEAYGAEMFFEICRFWADKSREDTETDRWHIDHVMGPDEFHEKYPDSSEGGVNDNAYTNLMTHWALTTAAVLYEGLSRSATDGLKAKIGLDKNEIMHWQNIAGRLNLVAESGILAQFAGYFSLKELDWAYYRQTYGDIHRMDRILKKEGKSPDAYKVAKQADALMIFFILGRRQVSGMLSSLGFETGKNFFEKNLDYYMQRTSHGSTLSRVVHAALARMKGDWQTSWQLYQEALASDYVDIQGGTTGEGIHTGVMAGTVVMAMTIYGGLSLEGDILQIAPQLPGLWKKLQFGIWFQKIRYEFEITKDEVKLVAEVPENGSISIEVKGKRHQVPSGQTVSFRL